MFTFFNVIFTPQKEIIEITLKINMKLSMNELKERKYFTPSIKFKRLFIKKRGP